MAVVLGEYRASKKLIVTNDDCPSVRQLQVLLIIQFATQFMSDEIRICHLSVAFRRSQQKHQKHTKH